MNNVFGSKRRSALLTATAMKYLKITEMLLLCPKVDMNITDLSGKKAIDLSTNLTVNMFMAREEILQKETHKHTCCVDTNNKLLRAAEIGDHKALRGLAQCPNANINIAGSKGRTPLYLASMNNNLKAVKELLAVASIDPNKGRNSDGKTPIAVSSENGHFEVMECLIDHTKLNVNEGWVNDNWPSHVDEEVTLFNNSVHYTTGISFDGDILNFSPL